MLSFPPFLLDVQGGRLWRGASEVRLRRRQFAILCYLAERPGRLVRRDELVAGVWNGVAVSDGVLREHVRQLRTVLGPTLIQTVRGLGYRFVADVKPTHDERPAS